MKNLSDYIKEDGEAIGIAPSIGAMQAASNFATPGNTMGIGDPKYPTPEKPGSGDILGKTRKEKDKKKKKCTKDEEEHD